jgi:hypothetical protein
MAKKLNGYDRNAALEAARHHIATALGYGDIGPVRVTDQDCMVAMANERPVILVWAPEEDRSIRLTRFTRKNSPPRSTMGQPTTFGQRAPAPPATGTSSRGCRIRSARSASCPRPKQHRPASRADAHAPMRLALSISSRSLTNCMSRSMRPASPSTVQTI